MVWYPIHCVLRFLVHKYYSKYLQEFSDLNIFKRSKRYESLITKYKNGETIYVIGLNAGMHNSGIGIIEIRNQGVKLIANLEEERFSGQKFTNKYPKLCLESLKEYMNDNGKSLNDIDLICTPWDHPALLCLLYSDLIMNCFQFLSNTLLMIRKCVGLKDSRSINIIKSWPAVVDEKYLRSGNLIRDVNSSFYRKSEIVTINHHDSHAYGSFVVSPFFGKGFSTLVIVIDGAGDDCSMSCYHSKSEKDELKRIWSNDDLDDSLGYLYTMISSVEGGWSMLSSEGRFMGAAAWGDLNRATNPFYPYMKNFFIYDTESIIKINTNMFSIYTYPYIYKPKAEKVFGSPRHIWEIFNPDNILDPLSTKHPEATVDRLNKAAALQLVFEDVIFHIFNVFIRKTGADKIVFSGGCALNCVASLRCLEVFNEKFYKREFNVNTRLSLWTPPFPSDCGQPICSALTCSYKLFPEVKFEPLKHAFYCGLRGYTRQEVLNEIKCFSSIDTFDFGNVKDSANQNILGDLMSFIISNNCILGIFQGAAETGPRALGHRSFLANASNPQIRDIINKNIKFRESVRPLAPMMTLESARKLFDLNSGASEDVFNAYNYMVMCCNAKEEAKRLIPSVVHEDGTSRIQIVREDVDPIIFSFLKGMGKRTGAEVSVNTSLNIGSPIVQTPKQALENVINKAVGLTAILFITKEMDAIFAFKNNVSTEINFRSQYTQWTQAGLKQR